MPNLIVHSDLLKMVPKVLQHIAADICEDNTESCHRLNRKSDHMVVKFLRGKTVNR